MNVSLEEARAEHAAFQRNYFAEVQQLNEQIHVMQSSPVATVSVSDQFVKSVYKTIVGYADNAMSAELQVQHLQQKLNASETVWHSVDQQNHQLMKLQADLVLSLVIIISHFSCL